jgi:sialic acid synthase SpsE
MPELILQNGKVIGDYLQPYIVAELNTSHFGDTEKAKEMVRAAKLSGCDAVKFQSWSEDTLYSESFYLRNPMARRFIKRFSFSQEQLFEIKEFCALLEIDFSSTPYSELEVDFLVQACDVPFLKVASMDIVNMQLLGHMAKSGRPIVLSTGMSDLSEIQSAVETIEKNGGERICILHCVSLYPTKSEEMNLLNILGLRKKFSRYPVGFSDHSEGTNLPIAATALGSALIEKHFTLDKSRIGLDNQMAVEFDELEVMVQGCRDVYKSLGSTSRVVSQAELNQRKIMRRSLVSARGIKSGEILTRNDLSYKRPGDGLTQEDGESLIGKISKRDIAEGIIISLDDFE